MKMGLELIATDTLIHELFKRYENVVCTMTKVHTKDKFETLHYYEGNRHVLLGLCTDVSGMILKDLNGEITNYD